jgi:hypothetical protein
MAVDGSYIRGNNTGLGVLWATEGRAVAGESMGVCRRLGAWVAACSWLQPRVRGRPL